MIAENRAFAQPRDASGNFRRRFQPTRARMRRLCELVYLTGSLTIAAPALGVPRSTVEEWMKSDPKIDARIRRAQALFLTRFARKLETESDPVLAMSARFILARMCPDFREPKTDVDKLVAALGKTVAFRRTPKAPTTAPATAAARN